MASPRGGFGRRFLENEQSECVTLRKTNDSIYCQGQNLSFNKKIGVVENLSAFVSLKVSQYIKPSLMRSAVILTNVTWGDTV